MDSHIPKQDKRQSTPEENAQNLLDIIVEQNEQRIDGTILTPENIIKKYLSSNWNSLVELLKFDSFAPAFGRLIKQDQRMTDDEKVRVMADLMKGFTEEAYFDLNVINKTTGRTETWLTHSSVSLKTTLYPHYGAARNLRFQFKGNTLFLSSCAKKSMGQLGFQAGDTLIIEEITTVPEVSSKHKEESHGLVASSTSNVKTTHKPSSKNKKRGGFKLPPKDYKLEHSTILTGVFNEADPIFRNIRHKLNADALKKSTPKDRTSDKEVTDQRIQIDSSVLAGLEPETKAGKSTYPVLVGSPNYLYCSRKKSLKSTKSVHVSDLHGCSCTEAIEILDSALPILVEDAMSEYPWVIPVNLICGCGSQTLSEIVEKWIKRNNAVANRPKTF